jgi:subtilisin family serine protease
MDHGGLMSTPFDRDPEQIGTVASPTGRYVVVLSQELQNDPAAAAEALRAVAGVSSVAHASDFSDNALDVDQATSADAAVLTDLGIGVISVDPEQAQSIIAAGQEDPRVVTVEPEQTMHALIQPPAHGLSPEYVRGFRDAAEDLCDHVNGQPTYTLVPPQTTAEPQTQFMDTAEFTWGLQATHATGSEHLGKHVPLAVLDTGFDQQHPDFRGRSITTRSFVTGESAQDGQGHGTH